MILRHPSIARRSHSGLSSSPERLDQDDAQFLNIIKPHMIHTWYPAIDRDLQSKPSILPE